jgi:hypothetical protein
LLELSNQAPDDPSAAAPEPSKGNRLDSTACESPSGQRNEADSADLISKIVFLSKIEPNKIKGFVNAGDLDQARIRTLAFLQS